MPTPREAYVNTVEAAPVAGQRVATADYGAAGETIGRAAQGFGQNLDQVSQDLHTRQLIFAEAAAKDGDNQIRQFYADKGFNGPTAYFNLSGKDALNAKASFQAGLTGKVNEVRATIKDPHALRMFNQAQAGQQAEWTQQIGAHEDREITTYHTTESTSRAGLAGNAAVVAATMPPPADPHAPGATDPVAESDRQIATMRNELAAVGDAKGEGADTIAFKQAQAEADTRLRILHTYNSSGGAGTQVAQAYLDKYRAQFGDKVPEAENAIRVMANAQQAEQRRAEADARRAEGEVRHDAGQRAADVAQQIHDGVWVTPETVNAAVTDAHTAQRPGLADQIHQGEAKNNLTLQYRDTPPAQILNDMNTLGARIARKGKAATADEHTKFEHLSVLYDKSHGELNQDPMSWGAQHSGIDPGPLNLSDQASIAAHLDAARKVTQLTGAPLRLMTNADAEIIQKQFSTGSAAQRQNIILNLAKFGNVSQLAAAQIKPGDDALLNAVDLAGASNSHVAAQHLEMITQGEEIRRTNPKLIKDNAADIRYAEHVGDALFFLPSVGRGARLNAASMAAYLAAHGGAQDWEGGGSAAYDKTVNDAFGAYKDPSGVVRGGIADINNQRTLLPDGMSVEEFQTAIATPLPAKWIKAQNGYPEGGFTFGQLRQMKFVAAPSGNYRLSNGTGFVHKKDGGFFEVDVRKLR